LSPVDFDELKQCSIKLDMLTGSKESIIQTSAHFLKLGDRNHALIPKLVELWCSKLKETTEKKKLSFIYLANEIINKSKA